MVPIALGISTNKDVPSSSKYKNIMVWENALHITVLADNPAIDLCDFQKLTSFLNDRKSNNNYKNHCINY